MIFFRRPWMGLSLLLWAMAGCTFAPPKVRLEVKWARPPMAKAAPDKVDDISCFFVNVSAPDILVNYGPESFGGRAPSCLNLGVIAGPYTLSELVKGVTIKVQPGSQRTIEILGAVSGSLGNLCHYTLPDYFNTTAPPQLYPLGSTTTKLFVDSAVTVKSDYSASTATDRVASCPGNEGGTTVVADGPISAVRVVGAFVTPPEIRTYSFSLPTLIPTFSPEETIATAPLGYIAGKFSDDFTRYALPYNDVNSTKIQLFSVSRERRLSPLSTYGSSALQNWNQFFIAPAAKNFYGVSSSLVYNVSHTGTTSSEEGNINLGGPVASVASPTHVFTFLPGTPNNILAAFPRLANGNLFEPTLYPAILASANLVSLAMDRSFKRLFVARPPNVESYAVSGGTLTFLNSVTLPAINPSSMVVNRAGTRLYYLDQAGVSSAVTFMEIDAEGRLTLSAKYTSVNHGGRLLLEPQGKVLFVDNSPIALTAVVLNETLSLGIGSKSSISLLGTDAVSTMITRTLDFAPVFANE